MIGSVLNERYRVLRRIGGGGMGDVFLVEHLALGRMEALKVLRPELAAEPSFVSRFRREASSARTWSYWAPDRAGCTEQSYKSWA